MNIFIIVLATFFQLFNQTSAGSFYIDFDNNTFVKDGKPFQYISGSIHSYRVPSELWEDRLYKMWAAGLNAVQIYLFWNEHEPQPGVYDFEGQNDIFKFVEMAQEKGLAVIFRAGPYACGEHDYGALPWWLLSNGVDSILPRSSEENYMIAVRRWLNVVLRKLEPYLYKNGGPVIMVQIENEYGSYFTCDRNYTSELRDIFRGILGDDVVYFTTDGDGTDYLKCGFINGVYPTVDFGPGTDIKSAFEAQRVYAPKGPLVNSEFYSGWLDLWGSPHSKVATKKILKTFYQLMEANANVNFYMFHGGTNFGFSNGADPPFLVQPTSYDYDSPISESGDITSKYLALRNAISKYLPVPQVPLPSNSSKFSYGNVEMDFYAPLVDVILKKANKCVNSTKPLSFEKLGQGYGIVLYMTKLSDLNVYGKNLSIPGIRDRAYVQLGYSSVGVLYRVNQTSLIIDIQDNKDDTLYLIVENMGRLNFGNDMLDSKGILSDVTLEGKPLTEWTACLTNNWIPNYQTGAQLNLDLDFGDFKSKKKENIDFRIPAVYYGTFRSESDYYDTFLKMNQFTKGLAFIQTDTSLTNLGKYWPHVGPQVTLYTPGVFIEPNADNYVVLFEFEGSQCQNDANCYVEFLDYPIIDSI